jgi:phospholipid-binding lipoprotein MlaA
LEQVKAFGLFLCVTHFPRIIGFRRPFLDLLWQMHYAVRTSHFGSSNMTFRYNHIIKASIVISTAVLLSACSKNATAEFHDPFENTNRKTHAFNKKLDQWLLRPAGNAYGAVFNETDDEIINNFTANLSEPANAVNHLIQGKLVKALKSTLRFAVNTTIGIGGIVDPATEFELAADETDFGETLHVWGAGEGAYVELPFYGGSTVRDTAGILVDFVMDPLDYAIPSKYKPYTVSAKLVELAGDRNEYSDVIDSVLYENEDSYASQRLYYLQNRRFELNDGEISDADLENPYDVE